MTVYSSNARGVLQPGPRRRKPRGAYARRRAAAVLVILLVIVVAGVAAYLLTRPGGSSAKAGTSSSTVAKQSGGSSTTVGDTSSTTQTTTPRPNGTPQTLELASDPKGAQMTITLQDLTTMTGTTPFEGQVPGGEVSISLSKDGYNTATRKVDLSSAQSVNMWLDPQGLLLQSLLRFKSGPRPKQVVFSRDGKELWVSLLAGKGFEVWDAATGKKLQHVLLGDEGSVEIIFNKSGTRAYVSQMETASVYEVDTATHTVLRNLKTGGTWTKILLLSPDEKTLWASNWVSGDVSEIDLATGKLLHRIPAVANPRGLYETEDQRYLYVAGFKNGDLLKLDLTTRKGTVIYKKTGGSMRHMVADEKKGVLYIDDLTSNDVMVLDLATDKMTKFADTDQCPNTMGITPDKKVLFVSCRGKDNPTSYYLKGPEWGSVLVFDTASGKMLDAIVGGNQPTGLDVSPDGKLLAFSDLLDDDIRIYKIPSYATFATGNGGRATAHLADLPKKK